MNKVLSKTAITVYHVVNGAQVPGLPPFGCICDPDELQDLSGDSTGIRGILSNIRGDLTNVTGRVREHLHGDVSNLRGDISGLWGNCSGLSGLATGVVGECTGLAGNLDEADISDGQRAHGVSITFLINQ